MVVYRFKTKRSLGGRSACMSCRAQLRFYELVPLFSYIFLRGRCRTCCSRISIQYPLVELISGIIFASLFWKFQSWFWTDPRLFLINFIFYSLAFLILLAISTYDIKHKIIPDEMSLALGVISLAGLFLFCTGGVAIHTPKLTDFLAGVYLFLPFALLSLGSRGAWMGFGDAKLALSLGWLLGVARGLSGVVLAFWIGTIAGVFLMLGKKKYGLKSEIPFAPFLAIGAFLAFIFNLNLFPF